MRTLPAIAMAVKLAPVRIPEQEQTMTQMTFVMVTVLAHTLFPSDETAKRDRAELTSKGILQACEAYSANPQNKTMTYPTILLELVKPPFGGFSFLRNGEKDLLDPWGEMFHYEVAKNEKGELQPYVWSERTVKGETKVIGTKPPEPKKAPEPKKK